MVCGSSAGHFVEARVRGGLVAAVLQAMGQGERASPKASGRDVLRD